MYEVRLDKKQQFFQELGIAIVYFTRGCFDES